MWDSYEESKDRSSVESRDDPVSLRKVELKGGISALIDETTLVIGLAAIRLGVEAAAVVKLQLGNGATLGTELVDGTIYAVQVSITSEAGVEVGIIFALENCGVS